MPTASTAPISNPSERAITYGAGLSVLFVSLFLIGPIFLIKYFSFDGNGQIQDGAAAATVAIGAIFRSNSRTLLRSTIMSAVRISFRTVTRRAVSSVLPTLIRVFLPSIQYRFGSQTNKGSWLKDLILGCFVLGLSFGGVVVWGGFLDSSALLYGFPLLISCSLAGSTLLLHVFLMFYFSRNETMNISVNTPLDGILIQAYFTAAFSYLPLSSDIVLEGSKKSKGKCAASALVGLLCFSLVLDTVGILINFELLECWAAHILLYVFVVIFPLRPLSGAEIFDYNRGLWAVTFVLCMICFWLNLPDVFYEVL
jgi:hypothetical protein